MEPLLKYLLCLVLLSKFTLNLGETKCIMPQNRPENVHRISSDDPLAFRMVEANPLPWQANIFLRNRTNSVHIISNVFCGGTIINSKVVISAANCFFDQTYDLSTLKVVVGGTLDTVVLEHLPSRLYNIAQINYFQNSNGIKKYRLNIVLLLLEKDIQFNHYIYPIPWQNDSNFSGIYVEPGLIGNSTAVGTIVRRCCGWAVHNFTVIEDDKCNAEFKHTEEETFCANLQRLRQRIRYYFIPSGAGIVFSKEIDNKKIYFLGGIALEYKCDYDTNSYQVKFLDVQHYATSISLLLNDIAERTVNCSGTYDVNSKLCGYSVNSSRTTTTTLTAIDTTTISSNSNNAGCLVPNDLTDAIKVYYITNRDQEIPKGSYTIINANVIYKCETNFTLVGNSINFCWNGVWTANHPKCAKLCSPVPLSETIRATCKIDDETISCHQLQRPNTIAYLDCVSGYRKSDDHIKEVIRCNRNGEWDFSAFSCVEITSPISSSTTVNPCLVPEELQNTISVYYATDTDQEIPKGSHVPSSVAVIYKCKTNYTLVRNTNNFCINGEWSDNHPVCEKFCSNSVLVGVTIKPICQRYGETIDCSEPIRPNTTVFIFCAKGYRKVDKDNIAMRFCQESGEWDQPLDQIICHPICGRAIKSSALSLIVGGENATITSAPWNVGIYSNIKDSNIFSNICGGTILNAKVVISAVHCFWNSSANGVYDPSHYKVAVGKYFRDFYAPEMIAPQIMNIAEIRHHQNYSDFGDYYANDIALLLLIDYIKFNNNIMPICLESNLAFNEKYVNPASIGRVAGWGFESPDARIGSTVLKVIDLPVVEYYKCKTLWAESADFITDDKFCAGKANGESACFGDSGGGLVLPTNEETPRFALRGIVSLAAGKDGNCDTSKYALFTNIQYHIDMILTYLHRNTPI